MKTIFILMDSLNRHYLNAYGDSFIKTPNLDRLAEKCAVFDNHYIGSAPCMPARRELMTGRLNFLETSWGAIEPWDDCLPTELRQQKGAYSHMITDHYHYFERGGTEYHSLFDSWEFERGQEGDGWRPLVREPQKPKERLGKERRADWVNRMFYDAEDETQYPTPRCFMCAMDFLENNHDSDNYHLHLEVFDPHEPFSCPEKYRKLYGDDWGGPFFEWPEYGPVKETQDAVKHIRSCYAGTLTMADVWLGKLLDKMDELDVWKDTAVVLTTDHGHMLGEHGFWAKNLTLCYEELVHIPLFVYHPDFDTGGKRVNALTTTIDIMPTIMDWHGAKLPPYVQGKSLTHLLSRDEPHHDAVLFGYFGKDINMFDGRYSYHRKPLPGAVAYRHTSAPKDMREFVPREHLKTAEYGVFLKHAYDIPHLRIKYESKTHAYAGTENCIFDIKNDKNQEKSIQNPDLETALSGKMRELLERYGAPKSEFERVGL